MTLKRLDRSQWQGFFDRIKKGLLGKQAEIEIASSANGLRVTANWKSLVSMSYDEQADVIELILDGAQYCVPSPRELYVGFGPTGLQSFGIVDVHNIWQIVLLRDPLWLPRTSATQNGNAVMSL